MLDFLYLCFRYHSEICLLGKILSDEAIRVLIGASLPGTVCMGEETGGTGFRFDHFSVPVLRAIVEGDGFLELLRQ